VSDHNYPFGDTYQVDSYGPGLGDLILPSTLGTIVGFANIQTFNLYPSPGPSTVIIDNHNPADFTLNVNFGPPPFGPGLGIAIPERQGHPGPAGKVLDSDSVVAAALAGVERSPTAGVAVTEAMAAHLLNSRPGWSDLLAVDQDSSDIGTVISR